MKILKITLIIILTFFPRESYTLTLGEAQRLMLENNKELQMKRSNIENQKYAVKEVKAMYQPSLASSASYTLFSEKSHISFSDSIQTPMGLLPLDMDRELGDYDRIEIGLDMSYPVFTGNSRKYLLESAKHSLNAENQGYNAIKNRIIFMLGAVYVKWDFSHKAFKIHNEMCEILQEELERTRLLYSKGVSTNTEVLRAEAALYNAELMLDISKAGADSLRYELCKIIGIKDSTVYPEGSSVIDSWKNRDYEFNENRFTIAMLEQNISQLNFSQKALSGKKFPNAAVFAGFRLANPGLNMGKDVFMNYFLAGARISWDIYDGFKNKMQRKKISSQISAVEYKKENLINDWKLEVEQAALMFDNASKMRISAEKSLKAAKALCKDLKNSVDAGVAVLTDYLKAVTKQNEAELAMLRAENIEKFAILRMKYSAGEELDYEK